MINNLATKLITSLLPMRFIANSYNPIFLYHSLGNNKLFNQNIDHVDLEILERQLKTIQKYWKFVSIDEYSRAKNKKSLASVTIDDGYKNILDEALPVFESLNIPFTVFVNSSTFNGKIFWRDKVRYLITNKLVKEFIMFSNIFQDMNIQNFYGYTKNPEFNSKIIEKEIDNFLYSKELIVEDSINLCFDSEKYLIKHPLVSYGNHTENHYVLSSLFNEEQYNEIYNCKIFLEQYDVNISKIFSVPFGGRTTINQDTIKILKDLNYAELLLSENNINRLSSYNYVDRVMPKNNNLSMSLKKLALKKIFLGDKDLF